MYFRDDFLKIYDTYVKREGADKLREYLIKSDFFVAPASSRFHNSVEGGLCDHSVNTYYRLKSNLKAQAEFNDLSYSEETIAIVSLLHDICKIDFYKQDYRNVKENGEWVKKPYFAREEVLPFGHGEKSVYILQSFIKLTREEAVAINWHMGGFDSRVKGGDPSLSEAYGKFPLAVLLHISDLQSAYIDENRNI